MADPTQVIPNDFLVALARRLGVTSAAYPAFVQFMNSWQPFEGGDAVSRNNPLNTTQDVPGGVNINDKGVKAYPDLATGVEATAKTLENGFYDHVLQALQTGNYGNVAQLAPEIQKWGTTGFARSLLNNGYQAPAPQPGNPDFAFASGDNLGYPQATPSGRPQSPNEALQQRDKWIQILSGLTAQRPDPTDPRFDPVTGTDNLTQAQQAWATAVGGVVDAIKSLDAVGTDNTATQTALSAFDAATTRQNAETGWQNAISGREDAISSAQNAVTNRQSADITRFLGGLGESRQRAQLEESAKEAAVPWATQPGKNSFSESDLGAWLTNYPGISSGANDPFLVYPTTVNLDPRQSMNWWDKSFGVTGQIPGVTPLTMDRSIASLQGQQTSYAGPNLAAAATSAMPAATDEWWKYNHG